MSPFNYIISNYHLGRSLQFLVSLGADWNMPFIESITGSDESEDIL